MGSPAIIDYLKNLPDNIKDKIEIKHVSCMNSCDRGPRVMVNDTVIYNATPERVKEAITEIIMA